MLTCMHEDLLTWPSILGCNASVHAYNILYICTYVQACHMYAYVQHAICMLICRHVTCMLMCRHTTWMLMCRHATCTFAFIHGFREGPDRKIKSSGVGGGAGGRIKLRIFRWVRSHLCPESREQGGLMKRKKRDGKSNDTFPFKGKQNDTEKFCDLIPRLIIYSSGQHFTSAIIQEFPHCSSVSLSVPQCSSLFLSVPQCSSVFLSVPHCSSLFLSVPHCSSVFLIVPQCSSVFLSAAHCKKYHK
jgi:hypothetical protein